MFDSLSDDNEEGQETLMADGGLEACLEAISRSDDTDLLLQTCQVVKNLANGGQDVIAKAQSLRFDVHGLLRHGAACGSTSVKHEVAATLKVTWQRSDNLLT